MLTTTGVALLVLFGQAPSSASEFLLQYPTQNQQIAQAYRRIRAKWVDRSSILPGQRGGWWTAYVVWDSRKTYRRHYEGSPREILSRPPIASFCTAERIIDVFEREGGPPVYVAYEGERRTAFYHIFSSWTLIVSGVYECGSLGYGEVTHAELLKAREDSLSIKLLDENAFSVKAKALPPAIVNTGTIEYVFSASRPWVPQRILYGKPGEYSNVHDFEYAGEINGVPRVKSVRLVTHNLKKDTKFVQIEQDMLEMTGLTEAPDETEFQPESLGAVSYAESIKEGGVSMWVWIVLIGVLLAAAAEYWRRRRLRNRRAKSP